MLHLITGPMFSGKSIELVRRAERIARANQPYKFYRPVRDIRPYLTHSNKSVEIISIETIKKLPKLEEAAHKIFIDEGNFFPEIEDWCWENIDKYEITIALLHSTAEGFLWMRNGANLFAWASTITHLNAVCQKCGKDANMTHYCGQIKKEEDILVGDAYEALCIDCWKTVTGVK